jgi:hypothetical protein
MNRLVIACLELGIEVQFRKDTMPYCIQVRFTKLHGDGFLWVTRVVDRTQLDRMRSPESYWDAILSSVVKEFDYMESQPTRVKNEQS